MQAAAAAMAGSSTKTTMLGGNVFWPGEFCAEVVAEVLRSFANVWGLDRIYDTQYMGMLITPKKM